MNSPWEVLVLIVLLFGRVAGAQRTFKYWFVFGDSYTTVHFNYTSTQPSPQNPIGNPPFPGVNTCTPTGRAPNWLNYLLNTYNTTLTLAYDFAVAGAKVDNSLVPIGGTPASFVDQISRFDDGYTDGKGSGRPGGMLNDWNGDNSIVAIWFGINDIGLTYNQPNRSTFNDELLDRYFELVTQLHVKYELQNFLFFNMPPMDRSPQGVQMSNHATETPIIADFNAKLAQRVQAFAFSNTTALRVLMDIQTLIGSLLDNPQENGFANATSVGTGREDIWCNASHLSPAAHDFIARAVVSVLNDTQTKTSYNIL
ncbi:hypothetical protein EXIGLDRAFT_832345 [Exidia glandulosa HHB12029]|uniref:Carbohydrate esterase family 16 protein n=1 Tax=Exidia glandulosa HHB12029 TaxID=1314781 RepID=A0A165LSF0_EXIGL|nr:hypothetical protein EXIGLDRAFT_832345 [Exidia glandulosa HHB12029]